MAKIKVKFRFESRVGCVVYSQYNKDYIYNTMKKLKRLTGGVVGAIVLGLVTNALWDILKPVSHTLYKTVLYISVLGIEKLKDGIYQEISKGMHEGVTLELYILINAVLLGLIIAICFAALVVRLRKSGKVTLAVKLERATLLSRHVGVWSFVSFIAVYMVFAVTVVSFSLVKTKYINQAITHYLQVLTIAKPYLNSNQVEKFNSEFAQIKNSKEYKNLINEIEDVLKDNQLEKPEFEILF